MGIQYSGSPQPLDCNKFLGEMGETYTVHRMIQRALKLVPDLTNKRDVDLALRMADFSPVQIEMYLERALALEIADRKGAKP